MAPINPIEILEAFAPLLTNTGGIKRVDENQFTELCRVMKDYSNKLVSKCMYCNILMATSTDVLEEFLKIGGWELIYQWVKSSKDAGNVSFLVELLKLLLILPMNIDRLRQNDCPKIVKKLCKHENAEVVQKASQIIKKWTRIIHAFSEKSSGQNGNATGKETKKRKSSESESSTVKKSKCKDNPSEQSAESTESDVSSTGNPTTASNLNDVDPYETFSRDDMNKFMVSQVKESKPRPTTAKVKQGKFRLDLSATTVKPKSSKKKPTTGADLKDSKVEEAKKVLEKSKNATKLTNSHVLKDSVSFMDALSVIPVVNKKRRKMNKEPESGNSTPPIPPSAAAAQTLANKITSQESKANLLSTDSSSCTGGGSGGTSISITSVSNDNRQESDEQPQTPPPPPLASECAKSPPRFTFYQDILEEKSTCENGDDSDKQGGITVGDEEGVKTEDSSQSPPPPPSPVKMEVDENSQFEASSTVVASTTPKSILNYVKKGSKKSVRWPDDSKLEQVRFFELDETERINVNRLKADMKRFDMKHEAQFMLEAKKCANEKCTTFAPWKFVSIQLDPQNVPVERGYNSRERAIQAERMRTTLECFYIKDQIPDTPHEPDLEFFGDSVEPPQQTVIIPLEDENFVSDKPPADYPISPIIGSGEQQPDYPLISNNEMKFSTDNSYIPPPPPAYGSNNSINNNYQPAPYQAPNYGPGNQAAAPPPPPGANNTNYSYNSYPPNQQPYQQPFPVNNNQPPASNYDYQPNNYLPPSHQNSPPNMFQNNGSGPPPSSQPYYNQNGPPPPPPPAADNTYNSYWSENGPMPQGYNPGPGGPMYPPPPPQQNGPRFRARGPNSGPRARGFHPRAGSEICRFFSKFGKCKFDTRCNFSHNVENQKPIRF